MSRRVSGYARGRRQATRLLSVVSLAWAVVGCEGSSDGTSLQPTAGSGGSGSSGGSGGSPTLTAGNGGTGGSPQELDGGADATTDAAADSGLDACERTEQSFTAWVATHLSCSVDSDCRVINDCGPHGDSFPINGSGSNEAEELYRNRCGGRGFDGFEQYAPRCREQRCVLGEQLQCCGCAPLDGGADAN